MSSPAGPTCKFLRESRSAPIIGLAWCMLAWLHVAPVEAQVAPVPPERMSAAEPIDELEAAPSRNGLSGVDRGPRKRQLGNTPDDIGLQIQESGSEFDALCPYGPLTPLHDCWERITRRLDRRTGLDLGFNYTALYQRAGAASGARDAGGGDLDFFGTWHLLGTEDRWPGYLVFDTETRHRYSAIPPADLGDSIGSLWGTAVDFDTLDFVLNQLYWEHGSSEDGVRYRIGRVDPSLIYDGYRYASDNYAFLSAAFSDTLPMALPDTGFGAALALYPYGETYIRMGVHDANGNRTRSGFDTFFGEGEYFTAVEFGVTPHFGTPCEGLYHVTFWHTDARRNANMPSDRGIAVTVEQQLGPEGKIVPFFRYAYAHRGLNDVRQNLALGVGLEEPFGQNADMIGLGFSWGQPSDRSLRDQYTFEAFYRIFLTPHTHLTPDLQVILDPSKAPNRDAVAVFGLRLRTLY